MNNTQTRAFANLDVCSPKGNPEYPLKLARLLLALQDELPFKLKNDTYYKKMHTLRDFHKFEVVLVAFFIFTLINKGKIVLLK